jgi:uncharacterized protein
MRRREARSAGAGSHLAKNLSAAGFHGVRGERNAQLVRRISSAQRLRTGRIRSFGSDSSMTTARAISMPRQRVAGRNLAAADGAPRIGYAGRMDEAVAFESAEVRGFLHRPPGAGRDGLVLTHGASGNCRSPLMLALAARFWAAGLSVLRVDLPFRQRRPRGPPSPSAAAGDRAGLRAALAALRQEVPGSLYLGGHSYGGRQASLLLAEDEAMAAGLLLLSYPLHPPGRPERLRTEHFAKLRLRTVFVHGTRDPFGNVDELRAAVKAMPLPPAIVVVDRAGHDLRRGDFDTAPAIAALLGAQVST